MENFSHLFGLTQALVTFIVATGLIWITAFVGDYAAETDGGWLHRHFHYLATANTGPVILVLEGVALSLLLWWLDFTLAALMIYVLGPFLWYRFVKVFSRV